MRRSASEIIRNLEMRIARLEKSAEPEPKSYRELGNAIVDSVYNKGPLSDLTKEQKKILLNLWKDMDSDTLGLLKSLQKRQASSDVESIANEIIKAITASYTNFKVQKNVRCEIGGYREASLIMHIDVVQSVDLPESANALSLRDQKKVKKIVMDHLKYQEKSSNGYHLLSKRATMSSSLRAEATFEGNNQWTRELLDNPAVQLGYKGQLVQEHSESHNKLQGVKLTVDGKLEWYVTSSHKWNCVLKREYQ